MNAETRPLSRRRWLVSLARNLTLGALGLFTWDLLARDPDHCFRRTLPCQACGLLSHCRLPDADSAREQSHARERTP